MTKPDTAIRLARRRCQPSAADAEALTRFSRQITRRAVRDERNAHQIGFRPGVTEKRNKTRTSKS
jgi:hypothetical protein